MNFLRFPNSKKDSFRGNYSRKYGMFHKSSSPKDFIRRTLVCSLLEILVRRATIADLCDLSILHKVVFQTWSGKFNTYFNKWQNIKGRSKFNQHIVSPHQCKGNLEYKFPSPKGKQYSKLPLAMFTFYSVNE